jgi:two-component sensor histidine kinase
MKRSETCLKKQSIGSVTIGDIHELLYRSPELARIDFELYLQRLADNLISF